MRFERILIIGTGKISAECVKHLCTLGLTNSIQVIEVEKVSFSVLEYICHKQDISYHCFSDKAEIEREILRFISERQVLIVSANNHYIFSKEIVNAPEVEIINYHYSLLPRYRGMNIPSWVIFNKEKETGITWHYVTAEIDKGKILAQKKITITENTTAYDIVRQGMRLAVEAWKEFIPELLIRKVPGEVLDYSGEDKLYRNKNLPLQGVLALDMPIEDMYRLLRSYDYGAFEVIPKLCVEYQGKKYRIMKYSYEKIEKEENGPSIKKNDKTLMVRKENQKIEMSILPIR